MASIRGIITGTNAAVWRTVNKAGVPWHKLPGPAAALNLAALREDLRHDNLHDTRDDRAGESEPEIADLPAYRTYDGTLQDPYDATMGSAQTRFGRNFPLEATAAEEPPRLVTPSPREVSRTVFWRDEFQPATGLNVLAAAWIQFQNHGWFGHGTNDPDRVFEIELGPDDDWDGEMLIERTTADRTRDPEDGRPSTYLNKVTHWWDGSAIYGSSEDQNRVMRSGEDGKMLLIDGKLPLEEDPVLAGIDRTGFNDNYWVGLALLHTLFVKEHNAICHMLKKTYPSWSDEKLFLTARLVNAALMAKIHTVEWTPGILNTPVLQTGMHANWYGALPEWMAATRFLTKAIDIEAGAGIIGSELKHHGASFAITEEFISVYRLHPLIPDDYPICDHRTGELIENVEFNDLMGNDTRAAVDKFGWTDLMYHFGTEYPGKITLHNHPRALMDHTRVTGQHLDLGTVDIFRDRERGVRRYNDFREQLRMPRITSFDKLTPNPAWNAELEELYAGNIDDVDLQVGLLGEEPPEGFGFSDTAFRIFILMASRRLKSDRFFTRDYTPEVYTAQGMEWIDKNTMADVIIRHFPELAPALEGSANAFAPWRKAGPRSGTA
ncbi:MAG: peroxidase [Marmoricola sp.]|nr:peroxidase [Marmoricola sp.]